MKNILLVLILALSVLACEDDTKKTEPQEETQVVETVIEEFSKKYVKLYNNMSREEKNQALLQASGNGEIEIVKYLVQNGADINTTDELGATALIRALWYEENIETVKYLVSNGAALNIQGNDSSYTALMNATHDGYLEAVKYLIENGADVNFRNYHDHTALLVAREKEHTEIIKLFEEENKKRDALVRKTLTKAVKNGDLEKNHIEAVEYLLDSGAEIDDLDIQDENYAKALMSASENGYIEIVKLLINRGTDVNQKNDYRATALIVASENGHIEIVKYLVDSDADINTQDDKNRVALMYASEKGHLKVVKYLVENGAKINIWGSFEVDDIPLLLASYNGHLEVVKYLVEKGADINIMSEYWSSTALIQASYNGHLEIVKYLVEKGADTHSIQTYIHAKNNEGETALDIAKKYKHKEVVEYLESLE